MIARFTHCWPAGGHGSRSGETSAPQAVIPIAAPAMFSACLDFGRFTGIKLRILDPFGCLLRQAAPEVPQ